MEYLEFIQNKKPRFYSSGFEILQEWINPNLFDYQIEIVKRACQKGPFMGIGSDGVSAIKMDRGFIGSELKESYFNTAKKNIEEAIQESKHLFSEIN